MSSSAGLKATLICLLKNTTVIVLFNVSISQDTSL